jgi:hypothetical protein
MLADFATASPSPRAQAAIFGAPSGHPRGAEASAGVRAVTLCEIVLGFNLVWRDQHRTSDISERPQRGGENAGSG